MQSRKKESDHKKIWLFFIFPVNFFVKRRYIVNELLFLASEQPSNTLTPVTHHKPHTDHLDAQMVNCPHMPQKVAQNGPERLLEGRFWVDGAHMGMVQIIEHKFRITE